MYCSSFLFHYRRCLEQGHSARSQPDSNMKLDQLRHSSYEQSLGTACGISATKIEKGASSTFNTSGFSVVFQDLP